MIFSTEHPLADALLGNGFCMEKILEPKPIDEFGKHEPKDFEK